MTSIFVTRRFSKYAIITCCITMAPQRNKIALHDKHSVLKRPQCTTKLNLTFILHDSTYCVTMTKETRDYMFLSPITHCNSDSYRQKVSLKGRCTRAVCTMLKKPYTYNTMKRAVIAQKSQSNDSQQNYLCNRFDNNKNCNFTRPPTYM